MLKRNYQTRDLRAFNARSTTPTLPDFNANALDYPMVPSAWEGKRGFRCNRYIGVFHKLYREFHATLPNAERQGFFDDFHRKSGGIVLERPHWNGRNTISVFSLLYDEGHTYLSIGGRTILRIENGVTRYLGAFGKVVEIPYSGEEVPAGVLRRFRRFLQIAQKIECSFGALPEPPYVPDFSVVEWSYGEKPVFKPIIRWTKKVKIKILSMSSSSYNWSIRLKDHNNRNYHKDDNGFIPKAYKVEINGVVAWLPHSILGERYESLHHKCDELEIPTWWLKKNNIPVK